MSPGDRKIPPNFFQLPLFQADESSTHALELFPEVWRQMEALASPEAGLRKEGLRVLQEMGAARISPLIAYLVATRLNDPDIEVRCLAIQALAAIFRPDPDGLPAPEAVRYAVVYFLNQMRTRWIFALIQARIFEPGLSEDVILLTRQCSYGGNHLAAILNERKAPLAVRQAAAALIGEAGFLAARPALEKTASRLAARLSGQQAMSFMVQEDNDEADLLPVVNQALAILDSA